MHKSNQSHFQNLPKVSYNRSKFKNDYNVKTSFNTGQLIPIMVKEILPGDNFELRTNSLIRLTTLIDPIFDNLFVDTYYFFVPNRLVWNHWQNFMGQNDTGTYDDMPTYSIPQVEAPAEGWNVGTIADYMSIPTGKTGFSVNALPFRAYSKIVNDWFRSENLDNPANIDYGDDDIVGSNGSNYVSDIVKGGMPFVANKFFDYFTSALPEPQKGDPVLLPLGSVSFPTDTSFEVRTSSSDISNPGSQTQLTFQNLSNNTPITGNGFLGTNNQGRLGQSTGSTFTANNTIAPKNLFAYAVGEYNIDSTANINDLRIAFQMQKYLEKDSRNGTRYIEFLFSHFGVSSSNKTLQRSEYLGGNRSDIRVNQVLQHSESTENSPLGSTGAYSVSFNSHYDFNHSFEEHGFIIGLAVVRYNHTYSQGLEKFWSRKNKFDFYDPLFANIGEQAILNKEIYLQGNTTDDEVFGYNEAWADYRYTPNKATGYLRPEVNLGLGSWSLTDKYNSLPLLSSSWLKEDKSNVDRVISVSSDNSHQFIAQFYFDLTTIRVMPVYSIPGLIDHH